MKSYSTDIRRRVVAAHDGTREQIAQRFSVSISWIRELIRQRDLTGSIEPKPHGGRAPAFDATAAARLPQAIRDDDDATLEDVRCSVPAVYWAPARMGIVRKKVATGGPAGPSRLDCRAVRVV